MKHLKHAYFGELNTEELMVMMYCGKKKFLIKIHLFK